MSHEFESGFFVKRPAWHGLGVVVDEAPTVEDAISIAGLDWEVLERPLLADLPDIGPQEVQSHKAIVRSTDHRVLGIVGERYRPLQNERAFNFFNPFLAEGIATLETAGSLMHGTRIWVLAKMTGATADVVQNDPVEAYLLLFNSHDGSTAVGIMFTPIRVVCHNTLSAAMQRGESSKSIIKVRHTDACEESLRVVQGAVDVARRSFEFSIESFRLMAKKNLSIEGFERYVRRVLVPNGLPEDIAETAGKEEVTDPRAMETLKNRFESGLGTDIPGVRGTVWGGYNAFTEWLEHERGRSEDTRLNSTWFGDGARLRDRAFTEALTLCK